MSTPVDAGEVRAALTQLSEIHAQLLRSEVFRGYRSRPLAITAGVAVLAAVLQGTSGSVSDAAGFVGLWAIAAGVCATVCAVDLWQRSWSDRSRGERTRVLRVLGQLAPAFVAGALVPFVLLRQSGVGIGLLPGLWALFFGLGVFASRPFLPRAVGWVGLWYCAAGGALLLCASEAVPGPWGMGLTFGVGQGMAAAVVHHGIERPLPEGC